MITSTWSTSAPEFEVFTQEHVRVPVAEGIELDCEIHRPAGEGRFPIILSVSPYHLWMQQAPVRPNSFSSVAMRHEGEEHPNSPMEAGDSTFFARRGYAHVVLNVRGSGQSDGLYQFTGEQEVEDLANAIEWLAAQEWSNGNVGMFGVSYFSTIQHLIGARPPQALKCLFAPHGSGGMREVMFHGGIFSVRFAAGWADTIDNCRAESQSLKEFGPEGFEQRIQAALANEELAIYPRVVEALKDPLSGPNAVLADIVLHLDDGPFWQERTPKYDDITIPIFLGSCWASYGIHLPGVFRAWPRIRSEYKRMVMGPPMYLDRPFFQFGYEALRWFDQWLKGVDTGVKNDPAVRVFVPGSGDWIESEQWPLPQTRWTPFNLHEGGMLSEHEFWWQEGHETFADSLWARESVEYWTPKLVDNVEIVGPIGLELSAAVLGPDVQWIVSLWEEDEEGTRRILTKGTLAGGYDEIDSAVYEPEHDFTVRRELAGDGIVKYRIKVTPTAKLFKVGTRIGLRIGCSDEPNPKTPLQSAGAAHTRSQRARRVAIFHDLDNPSTLWLPVTRGNVLGTFYSGGAKYFDWAD